MRTKTSIEDCVRFWLGYVAFVSVTLAAIFAVDAVVRLFR